MANSANSHWPSPQFHFLVEWDSQLMTFSEVSGLDVETQTIEYRAGDSKQFSTVKMLGLKNMGNITLKRGVFQSDHNFWDWFKQIKPNTNKRVPVTIRLLDETGASVMSWTLSNAWPSKITGTDLSSDSHQVAIETMEIAHEGLTIENG